MLNYLKLKQEMVDLQDFSCYKEEKDKNNFLNCCAFLLHYENMFLTLDPRMSQNILRMLDTMICESNDEISSKACMIGKKVEKVMTFNHDNPKRQDDYYQWISLIRTADGVELSQEEQLRMARNDFQNIKKLAGDDWYDLVGCFDLLTTLNFTMNLFRGVYQENPELLSRSQVIIEESLANNPPKHYKKNAQKALKNIKKRQKAMHDEVKTYYKRG